jgi:STE24 endopeptidase
MNAVGIVILTALVGEYILNLISDRFNLRHLDPSVPDAFAEVYDADRYRRSQEYLRTTTRFGWIAGGVELGAFLIFWLAGGFPLLDAWVRSLELGPIVTGLIFIGALVLLQTAIQLPFDIYDTFVIEARFGFNRTTPKTFVADRLKGLALMAALGGPLLAGVLLFFEFAGPHAWLLCWGAVTLYLLAVQYIAPTWIMPLFNRFEPLADGDLRRRIFDYARSVGFPLDNVFVIDGSRRSEKSNAFFTGFGKHKRIALFDTLMERHPAREILAVLAHEIGHYKKRHILESLVIGIIHMGVVFYLLSLFLTAPPLFSAFYLDQPSVYAGLVFFGILYAPIELVLGLLLQMRSRKNEYDADRYAVRTTGDPDALAGALKTLSAHNLTNLTPHPFYVLLHYSHPPVLDRLRAIRGVRPAS